MAPLKLVCLAITLSISALSHAHSGRTNAYGCHNETATGGYHCHNSGTPTLPDLSTYNRADYLTSWKDEDNDCLDTRQEVLIRESRVAVTFDSSGCRVISGEWQDPFTGNVYTDPGALDIDHTVPLEAAHNAGAKNWTSLRKQAFANDLLNRNTLVAVSLNENRSKGSKGPDEWLPPNIAYRCEYVKNWVQIKTRNGLTLDSDEIVAIEQVIGGNIAMVAPQESMGWDAGQQRSSLAIFSLGLRRQDECGYIPRATPTDDIVVTASILPDPAHLNEAIDIFLVAAMGGNLFSITSTGTFIPFNGNFDELVAFRSRDQLIESIDLPVFSGVLNAELGFDLFMGYRTESDDFVYSRFPIKFEIKE